MKEFIKKYLLVLLWTLVIICEYVTLILGDGVRFMLTCIVIQCASINVLFELIERWEEKDGK